MIWIHIKENCKTIWPFAHIPMYTGLRVKSAYIREKELGMCAKGQIILEFSLMWIWVTCTLKSICLDITQIQPSITPLKSYIRNPLDTLKRGGIEEQENYSPLFPKLILEYASICPLEHFLFFPSLPLLVSLLSRDGGLKWWRPRWRTQFLQFADVPREVVTIVIYVLY